MRLDKFLKVSRLIKRRTLAKEVADQGRITVNGNQAKASSDVKAGDELTVLRAEACHREGKRIERNNEKRRSRGHVYNRQRRKTRRIGLF